MAKTIFQTTLFNLDYYLNLEGGTVVFVVNLSTNGGVSLIKEAQARGFKIYKGTAKRKTTKRMWLKHFITGMGKPNIIYIELSNGVKIRDYSKFDPCANPDPVEAQELCELLVNEYDAPITPTSIIRAKFPIINELQYKNSYGVTVKEWDRDVIRFAHGSFKGGACYNLRRNGAYKLIPNETHVDFHQMYGAIMLRKSFPVFTGGYTIVEDYVDHPLAIYHLGEGRIKLKPNGFPLLSIKDKPNLDLEEYFKDYVELPWTYMTKIDFDILIENFDIDPDNPIGICETFYYNNSISGNQIFGSFIKEIYQCRKNSKGAIKRFYKMVNEYLPGTFERASECNNMWSENLETNTDAKNVKLFNNIIGTFITAYGRQSLYRLIKLFPGKKVLGYDTDCVFFAGTPRQVPPEVKMRFGDDMGSLHFDGIYTKACHLAPKQYFGFEEGRLVAKMAGVPNAVEVAQQIIDAKYDITKVFCEQTLCLWNKETKEFEEHTFLTNKVSLTNFKDYERKEITYEEIQRKTKEYIETHRDDLGYDQDGQPSL